MKELIVALVTPFKNLKLDENSLINIVKSVEKDSDGVLILGSTAESSLLTLEEKLKICDIVFKNYSKNIYVGLEGRSVDEIITLSKSFEKYNVYAYLITPISYIKPTQKGIIKYYMELADKLNKPIILYNVPKRVGCSIDIASLKILKNHYNIIGIKDATSDDSYTKELGNLADSNFLVFSGDDTNVLTSLLYNGSGLISVLANKYPKLMKTIINEFPSTKLYYTYKELIDSVFIETSPLPIKYMLGNIESKSELGTLKTASKLLLDRLINDYETSNLNSK